MNLAKRSHATQRSRVSNNLYSKGLSFLLIGYLSVIGFFISTSQAQNVADYVNSRGVINDQMLVMDIMETKYPGYKQKVQETFDRNNYIDMSKNAKSAILDVNVVFHVVYQAPEENIDDSVLYNQIDVLNEDFLRLNADSSNLRSIFTPIAGRPNIRFNVAQIIRVPTTSTFSVGFSGLPDNVKQTANGGSDAWNTDHYVNIWVCKLESLFGALFGYAYPPDGLPNWPAGSAAPSPELDGVVLDYRTVGRNNPNPFDDGAGGVFAINGRTATHEVGHYFGMRHIWGDGGGFFGGDSCGEDDGITDTPNQGAQSNFDCDTTLNTCIDSLGGLPDPADLPDLIENHMDYSDEYCKNMWTQMQATFMRNVLQNERMLLLEPESVGEFLPLEFSIYPNPASTNFNLVLPLLDEVGSMQVTDVLGNIVMTRQLPAGSAQQVQFSSENMAAGVYLVEVRSGVKVSAKRLVVQ